MDSSQSSAQHSPQETSRLQPPFGISRASIHGVPMPCVMSPEALCALTCWGQDDRPEPKAADSLCSSPVPPACPASPGLCLCYLPPKAHSLGTFPALAARHPSLFHGPKAQEGHPGHLGMPNTMLHAQDSAPKGSGDPAGQ